MPCKEHVGPLSLSVVLLNDARGHYCGFTEGCQDWPRREPQIPATDTIAA